MPCQTHTRKKKKKKKRQTDRQTVRQRRGTSFFCVWCSHGVKKERNPIDARAGVIFFRGEVTVTQSAREKNMTTFTFIRCDN